MQGGADGGVHGDRNRLQMYTLNYPEENRLSMRISDWYDRTARYRKQPFDLDKKDYLTSKTTEHENQVLLQHRIGTGLK